MAQRPLTRWYFDYYTDGTRVRDSNSFDILFSQTDVDAMYTQDLYYSYTGHYPMPNDGVYQVHFRLDRVDPTSDQFFARKYRFTKDSSQFPVIRGEVWINDSWLGITFAVQGNAGVDLLDYIGISDSQSPFFGFSMQGPGTYTLIEDFYSDDGAGDLAPLMDTNVIHTYDLREIQIQNYKATPNHFNIDDEDETKNKAIITGDLVTLPLSTTLYPSGWKPTGAVTVITQLPTVVSTITDPDSDGVVGTFQSEWDGYLVRFGREDQPNTIYPADGPFAFDATATAPVPGGGTVLTNKPTVEVVAVCCRCLAQAMTGYPQLGMGFSMLQTPYGPELFCGACYCGLNHDNPARSMGYGWGSGAPRLTEFSNGNLAYNNGGSGSLGWRLTAGTYQPTREDNHVLAAKDVSNLDTPFELTFPDRSRQLFGSNGKIVSEVDTRGQARSYTYNGSEQLSRITDASGRFLQYSYGDRTDGQPVSIDAYHPQDPTTIVRTVSFGYYADDDSISPNRLRSIDAEGIETTFRYDEKGFLVHVRDPQSQVAYTHDDFGRVTSEYHAGPGDSPALQMVRMYFFNGGVRIAEWDSFSPSGEADLPRLRVLYMAPRSMIGHISELFSGGTVEDFNVLGGGDFNETDFSYNDLHETDTEYHSNPYLLTRQVDPNGAITTMTYNLLGDMSTVTDAQGNTTRYLYGYDLFGPTAPFPHHLYEIHRPQVTVDGLLVQYDPTVFEYDDFGSLTKVTDASGSETHFVLNGQGQVTSLTDRLGRVTTFSYGTYGNLESVTTPAGPGSAPSRTYSFGYDALDRLTIVTDPLGNTWTTEFDDGDRPTQMTDPSGQQVIMTYLDGLLQTIEGPPNQGSGIHRRTTSLSYDSGSRMNRVDAHISPTEQVMRVRYDFTGFSTLRKLVRLMNSDEKFTSYQRDRLGRTTTVTDPLDRSTGIEHAPFCTEHTVTTARGILRKYTHDTLCRLTQVDMGTSLDTPEETRQYFYDELGRLIKASQSGPPGQARYGSAHYGLDRYGEGKETRRFAYDPLDRLTQVTFPDEKTLKFEYNAEDNLTRMTDMGGSVTEYEYYADNRLRHVIVKRPNQTDRVFRYRYDGAGRLLEIKYPGSTGIVARFTDPFGNSGWDANGRLTYLRYLQGSTHLHSFAYSYDFAGNRVQMIDTPTDTSQVKTWEYGYDWLNRLTSVTLNDTLHTVYGYDESDNRVSIEWPELSETHTFDIDAADQLMTRYLNDDEVEDFLYDQDGNLTSRTLLDGDMMTTYSWNADDRLVALTQPDTSVVRESYDADGIRKRQSGGNSYFSTDKSLYDIRPTGPVAFIQGHQLLGYETGNAFYYYISDGLSTVREVVDASGTNVATFDHEAFGEPRDYDTSGGGDDAHSFVGALGVRNENSSAGLLLMRQRWYDPTTAKFLSRDPIGVAGGLNLYAYAENNSVNANDPSGRGVWDDLLGEGTYTSSGTFTKVLPPSSVLLECSDAGLIAPPAMAAFAIYALTSTYAPAAAAALFPYPLPGTIPAGIMPPGPAMGQADQAMARALSPKSPLQVVPGTQRLGGQYINDRGRVEPWDAHYDRYGRQIGRTDCNAGNLRQRIPDIHHSRRIYGPGYGPKGFEIEQHSPGVYPGPYHPGH